MKRLAILMTVLFAVMTVLSVIGWMKALSPAETATPEDLSINPPADEPGEQPAEPEPEAPSDAPQPVKPWEDWAATSPLRVKMRSMWFDSSVIVGNSLYPSMADRYVLRVAANDIAAKAGAFATHWESVRSGIREAAGAVNANDWARVQNQLLETEASCEGCHYENWSLASHGVGRPTLEAWHEADTVFSGPRWGPQQLNSTPQWVNNMLRMRFTLRRAQRAANELDKSAVLRHTLTINNFADEHATRWRGIEAQARAIARIAEGGRLEDVSGHYLKMRSACMECHELYAPENGLAPVDWK